MSRKVLVFDFLSVPMPDLSVGLFEDGKVRDVNVSDLLNDSRKGSNLKTLINATHSGTIVNNRVYPGLRMRPSTKTWLEPYPRPVTDAHPAPLGRMLGIGGEPKTIGRVYSADYRQLVSDADLANDWKSPGVRDQGSGFIQLGTSISDLEAIDAVISERMLTVSSGQRLSSVTCSVCSRNWLARDGRCEHSPGETYEIEEEDAGDGDKKSRKVRMFLITGDLDYDHIAMVMTPAQPHARIVESVLGDSHEDGIEYRLPFQDFYDNTPDRGSLVSMVLTDGDGNRPVILGDSAAVLEALVQPLKVSKTTMVQIPGGGEAPYRAAKGVLLDSKTSPEEDPMDNAEKRILTSMALADRHILASLGDIELSWDTMDQTREELEDIGKKLDSEDYALADSQLALLFDGADNIPDDVRKDRRLTADARAKLPDTTFCGPNRSFPVCDALHAAMAKIRLQQSTLSVDQKKTVLSAINQKAKAMGCMRKGTSDIDHLVDVEPGAHLGASKVLEDVKVTDSEGTPKVEDLHVLDKEQLITRLGSIQLQLKDKSTESAKLLEELVDAQEEVRVLLAHQIYDLRVQVGRRNLPDALDQEAVKVFIDDIASSRSLDYLRDSIDELRAELSAQPLPGVEDPTLSDQSQDRTTVNDNGKVENPKAPETPKTQFEHRMAGTKLSN